MARKTQRRAKLLVRAVKTLGKETGLGRKEAAQQIRQFRTKPGGKKAIRSTVRVRRKIFGGRRMV